MFLSVSLFSLLLLWVFPGDTGEGHTVNTADTPRMYLQHIQQHTLSQFVTTHQLG